MKEKNNINGVFNNNFDTNIKKTYKIYNLLSSFIIMMLLILFSGGISVVCAAGDGAGDTAC
ncbi:MAG: hypothetical protein A7316_08460 [Candidatus Altiarchaeales archaeon WOR_SM1_86-2]|nr:MAG: hypothetical protein A7316_08460 [Candidatus Altiarchaeales archaeon WOR_SM1_86-2]